ncbi:hypothetical protein [Candidatus Parabeggiatoa sp. HSG14]|uniref:hypothetical protein n=1 Tax=Candidatus Parabeggiatoa sp. HSG14 TaxID=3055593 RepID=UPI0025A83D00|nr:hypothetical protein [Thiotrichales bacterium HSG14]
MNKKIDTEEMLTEMCQEILTNTDINAICKSRGFSARESSSRTIFRNFFLSDIGVKSAFASLNEEEITLLHLLKMESTKVDIRFFEKLYGDKTSKRGTFTQRYTPTFKEVQRNLVRKGLLLVATAPDRSGKKAKIEKLCFAFPQAFEKFLPSLFCKTIVFEGKGKIEQKTLRQKVLNILDSKKKLPFDDKAKYHLFVKAGQLFMGDELFSADKLLAWQQDYWHEYVWSDIKKSKPKPKQKVPFFTEDDIAAIKIEQKQFPPIVRDAFAQLEPNQWVNAEALATLLRLFYDGVTSSPKSKSVCEVGWKIGCLAKHTEKGKYYYRLSPNLQQKEDNPSDYLTISNEGAVNINMKNVPFDSLAHIAAISDLQISAYSLKATPNFIKMGNAKEAVCDHPLTHWIKENASIYQKMMAKIKTRRGQQIVHNDLLFAKVKDLSLRVQIQKKFADSTSVVFLPNDFIAFPFYFMDDIQKLVTKAGFVVKTVYAYR